MWLSSTTAHMPRLARLFAIAAISVIGMGNASNPIINAAPPFHVYRKWIGFRMDRFNSTRETNDVSPILLFYRTYTLMSTVYANFFRKISCTADGLALP